MFKQMLLSLTAASIIAATANQQYEHSFVVAGARDIQTSGGASVTGNPLLSIRSGNPNDRSVAAFVLPLASGITLSHVSFDYRYSVGFGAPAPGTGTNFSLTVAGLALYHSPHYNDYPYSHQANYSLPVSVRAPLALQVPKSGPASRLEFHFDNNGIARLCNRGWSGMRRVRGKWCRRHHKRTGTLA